MQEMEDVRDGENKRMQMMEKKRLEKRLKTRLRSGKWAIQGDIKKMFWQIKPTESDERYHGVVYKGETYVFTRVCFGN